MTVARDAALEFAEFTTTSPATLSFTPTGTPRAITVEICTVEIADSITGVTYGGVTMARIDSAVKDAPGEAGRVYTYFLGASIPTGTQTVSIAHDGSATQKWALVRSFTAGADTEVVTFNQLVGIQANPSIALDTGATESLRTAILYSGVGALSGFVELSGMEAVAAGEGNDFGNETTVGGVQTTAATGSFTIGWTAASDDVAMVAVAIQEVSGAGTQNLTGTLFSKAPTFNAGTVTSIRSLTGTLFVTASAFNTGAVTAGYPLTGALFVNPSTFFAGAVTPGAVTLPGTLFVKASTLFVGSITNEGGTQNLSGALFQQPSTFNPGAVTTTYGLTGTLFAETPTFNVGTVSTAALELTGTLFQKTPSFFAGSVTSVSQLSAFPIRQQISRFLTGTSISAELRVAPIQDSMVFALVSAATTLANMGGPSGYSLAAEEQGDGVSIQLWYKRAGAAESPTVTATSSASVALKIHVWESPEGLFVAGDPLDVTDTNDSLTSAVTTLSAGTTATTGQANTFAIAAVAALGGNLDFRLVSWSDGFTALSDHETLGLMGAYKVMTAAEAATATATWSQATTPTSHKAAGLVATFAMAVNLTVPAPAPRRVAFSTLRDVRNTTGTTDMVATFPVVQDHLYLAFVATSKLGANNGNASIATSHGGTVTWTLAQSHFIGSSRRVHLFRALAASNQSAASLTITTPETTCAVWCLVLDITGIDLSGSNGSGALRQIVADDEPSGATFLDASFPIAPLSTNAVVGFCFHGAAERQLIDDDPDIHLLFAESIMASEAQQATVDWFYGTDQTFHWDWATSIHALAIIAEVAIPSIGVSQVPNATVSNVGWDTAPLAGQSIHTYIATDDADYITVTVP